MGMAAARSRAWSVSSLAMPLHATLPSGVVFPSSMIANRTLCISSAATTSDFQLSFPGLPAVCTIHHHKQLWWTTVDPSLHALLEKMVP